MKQISTLSIVLLSCSLVFSQQRMVSGRLKDSGGNPQPGISVVIKGTTTGTVSDVNGYYTILAPVGSTLVFSFIGMKTREMIVTSEDLKSTKVITGQQKKSSSFARSLFSDSIPDHHPGITFLSDQTPSYFNRAAISSSSIKAIRKRGKNYIIKSYDDLPAVPAISGQLTSSVSFEKVNKLPSLQTDYAQGRPVGGALQWRGPDQNEIFSWGPLVRTLEYDGSNYAFDKNGKLVPAGNGNKIKANTYTPLSLFRTGVSSSTEFLLVLPAFKRGTFIFNLERRTRQGIIPNSDYTRENISIRLKDFRLSGKTKINGYAAYHSSEGNLVSRGANLATIIGSVYSTPVTFDNANGLSRSAALHSPDAYLQSNGASRSQAPGAINNPYLLVNELPDREKQNRLLSTLNLQRHSDKWDVTGNANFDKQNNTIVHGFPVGYPAYTKGRLTTRNEGQTYVNAMVTPTYTSGAIHYGEIKANFSYQVNFIERVLHRQDGFGFNTDAYQLENADSLILLNRNLSRLSQETAVNFQYRLDNFILLKFSNRNYFSNTISNKSYVNLFPSASVSIDLANKLNYIWPINRLEPYFTLSRTIRESPLIYSNWSYASTQQPLSAYSSYFESTELFFHSSLAPETERKLEIGLKASVASDFTFEFNYYNNLTHDFISPEWKNDRFILANTASIKNEGVNLMLSYSNYNGLLDWGTDLRWSKYKSVVEELNSSAPWIALSGFSSVASVLAPGQPVGAIYGTAFQRNANNQVIIGNDGYPLVDPELKMIGNPIPKWMLGWSGFAEWKRIKMSFLFDFKNGGQTWNGTSHLLDYLGKSETTASLRTTANYIFDGVNLSGNTNSQAVSFADPSQPVESNRWVRYGTAGVAEEYIQNTSWARLSELVLSYSTRRTSQRTLIKEAKFSLIGRNLLLLTPYKGVDPAATLFGYTTGAGLDLFNTPSTRGYSAMITLKF